jgi:hypothetical protein
VLRITPRSSSPQTSGAADGRELILMFLFVATGFRIRTLILVKNLCLSLAAFDIQQFCECQLRRIVLHPKWSLLMDLSRHRVPDMLR